MSYFALARKWRPIRFGEVIGQSHVLTALANAFAQNRLHHAYLFSGTHGVGKTTICRLFSKGLNCIVGITSTPCGVCNNCKEIDEGRFVDLLEIDAASRTKVEDTRDLLDNVQYKPSCGRFKIYLIDEVHMLSKHSFNAFLKTLEEPPEHVKFLLATTNPEKLPMTVLSRCLHFHLKPISADDINQKLEYILMKEEVAVETRALRMISHFADGSMRDALSLIDQAIVLCNGNNIDSDTVTQMLGTLDSEKVIHLLEAICCSQSQAVIDSVRTLDRNGVDWDNLLQQLAIQLHSVAMHQALPSTLDKTQPGSEKIELLSKSLSPQKVQLYYQIALKGREDLSLSPSKRVGLEMILLRMIAFKPEFPIVNSISTKIPGKSSAPVFFTESRSREIQPTAIVSKKSKVVETMKAEGLSTSSSVMQSIGLRHKLRSQRQDLEVSKDVKTSGLVLDYLAQKQSGTSKKQVSRRLDSEQELVSNIYLKDEDEIDRLKLTKSVFETTTKKLDKEKKVLKHVKTPEIMKKIVEESIEQDAWSAVIYDLKSSERAKELALNSFYKKVGNSIILVLRPNQVHLNTDEIRKELLESLNMFWNAECNLSVKIGRDGETPIELREKIYQSRLKKAFISLENDCNIRFIKERFLADLDKDSVRPI
ncbi:DNA polymerase III subunit tau [Candidatus Photodesmus blepharus]|uniref:DNA polymerase III subunit gamma/tau n=1 Tax=Candidatus Photodesmus blepharonis TaxID=1179155 RepID=A0A084CML0_9GAMM|nr:DNA polymerase III subunit gamma/tau [Candidatus Photodesmus blepharus]KEY91039.1 DNA polymerase III subunit tau [Candidatus Photodesmus blepharus]